MKIPGISYELQERYNAQSFKIGKMQREKGREPRREEDRREWGGREEEPKCKVGVQPHTKLNSVPLSSVVHLNTKSHSRIAK